VEPPAKVGDLRLGLLVLGLRDLQRRLEPRKLLAEGEDLLVQQRDLGLRLGGEALLALDFLFLAEIERLQFGKPDLARLQLLLRERGALRLGREPRLQLLRAVAKLGYLARLGG